MIAICCTRNNMHARYDRRFGRCPWFLVWDRKKMQGYFLENDFKTEEEDVGIHVAENLAQRGVKVVFATDFGHKAAEKLKELGIQMFLLRDDGLNLEEILKLKGRQYSIAE